MTESEWLACKDPGPMLEFLRGKVSDRKLRLFAVNCFRYQWHWLIDRERAAVLVLEEFVMGGTTAEEFEAAAADDTASTRIAAFRQAIFSRNGFDTAYAAAMITLQSDDLNKRDDRTKVEYMRHFLGNPFRPYPAPPSWPSLIVDLAQQLYDGADVRLVLHDALLDAGHQELAEHFANEDRHPKGCWAMDAILGRG